MARGHRDLVVRPLVCGAAFAAFLLAPRAHARPESASAPNAPADSAAPVSPVESSAPAPETPPPSLSPDTSIDFSTEPPEGKTLDESAASAEALAGPPPIRPRHRGLVLESTLGALGFAGQFRHVAPPAYWLHAQLGIEALRWLMIFAGAELALTETTESLAESQAFTFPIWGFGGGARATIHATDRVAVVLQGEIDALTAHVPHDALGILGYRNVESLAPAYGARVGVEWYQVDRHFALFVAAGARYAPSFARTIGPSDVPLLWDSGAGVRYTF